MNDVQRFGRIQVEMCDTFKSKNADYGNSFSQLYQEFGDNGIITAAVQISHKYHRFMNLIKGTPAKVNESLRDTLLDLANYCVLTVMELDKAKERKSASASASASAVTYRTTPQFDYSKYISDYPIIATSSTPAATLKGDTEPLSALQGAE
jgi:hypothetical protein